MLFRVSSCSQPILILQPKTFLYYCSNCQKVCCCICINFNIVASPPLWKSEVFAQCVAVNHCEREQPDRQRLTKGLMLSESLTGSLFACSLGGKDSLAFPRRRTLCSRLSEEYHGFTSCCSPQDQQSEPSASNPLLCEDACFHISCEATVSYLIRTFQMIKMLLKNLSHTICCRLSVSDWV